MKRMEDEEGEQQATLVQMDLMQESSNQEIQTLNNIKRQVRFTQRSFFERREAHFHTIFENLIKVFYVDLNVFQNYTHT